MRLRCRRASSWRICKFSTAQPSVRNGGAVADQGLWRVNGELLRMAFAQHPVAQATLDMDATLIETQKREALYCYKHFKAYQPLNTWWAEQSLIVHSEFRDGNVPAGLGLPGLDSNQRYLSPYCLPRNQRLPYHQNRPQRFWPRRREHADLGRAFVAATPAKRNSNGGRAQDMSVEGAPCARSLGSLRLGTRRRSETQHPPLV